MRHLTNGASFFSIRSRKNIFCRQSFFFSPFFQYFCTHKFFFVKNYTNDHNMESSRLNKIDRLVQKELSDIFQKFTKSCGGVLISVTSVSVSADLSIARVRLSIFPNNKQEEMMDMIKKSAKSIRHDLAQRTRHQLRIVPELTFFLDDSLDYLEKIDRLLGLDKKDQSAE